MRRDVLLLLCSFYLLPLGAHADDSGLSAKDIKTLFFGHDDRKAVNCPEESPWDAIGQLETASGNLCTATLISPHLALTAGHCLLTPPRGKPDKAVALRFISRKGNWVYEIHGIDGRVDSQLRQTPESRWRRLDCPFRCSAVRFWSDRAALMLRLALRQSRSFRAARPISPPR